MRFLKVFLAIIALMLAFDNVGREQYRLAGYWALVYVYWAVNALT